LKDRLRSRCNVAVAEIDYQDSWKHGLVAAVTVSPDKPYAEKILQSAEREAAALLGPLLWMSPSSGCVKASDLPGPRQVLVNAALAASS
jgi:hypothetical protein